MKVEMDFAMPKKPLSQYTIKTVCGIDKYRLLQRDKSLFGRLRLGWFFVFASIRDIFK